MNFTSPPDGARSFLRALAGETLATPPVWLMRQAGRYLPEYRAVRAEAGSFLSLCYDPVKAAEVTLQPIRRFGFDAAIIFSDILVVPHALGQPVDFREGEGPVLDPLADGAAVARLSLDDVTPRLAPVYEAVARVREGLPSETALIGFCGAPWTVATYMIGGRGSSDQAASRKFAYREREATSALMDILVEASFRHLSAQIDAGADAVQIFDSWAGTLPEDEFSRWVTRPTAELTAKLKARSPHVPVIGFPRGAGGLSGAYLAETGVDAIGCDTATPLAEMRALQEQKPVQGNLDPLLLVAGGDLMRRRVDATLAALSGGPFVFNLGHGIVPETPPEHVAELVARIRGA
jgi:uroporphyrinogen decarboxylase